MIKIGTGGFQLKDWVGTVYPRKTKQQDMLAYYEQKLGFDALEVNYTYYSLPYPRTMEGMMRKTSEKFEFVVRSHKEMTHEIWLDEKRTRLGDNRDVFDKFMAGLKPLIREKRLGCALLQFPYFFAPKQENYDLGFCIVDEPRLYGLMPTTFEVTGKIAYLRFHGRNKNWFRASKDERYLYDSQSECLYAFFNNCPMGFSAKNARTFKKLIRSS